MLATATEAPESRDPLVELDIEPPVLVLSDLHLGHPASNLKDPLALAPLLGPARTAIFNGDSCELLSRRRREESTRLLTRLMEMCESRGVKPVFITGNHDPRISSLHHLDLFGAKVFLTHGDILHPMVAPWSKEGPPMGEERHRLLAGRPEPERLDNSLLLTKRVTLVAAIYHAPVRHSLAARAEMFGRFIIRPSRILQTLEYWASVAHRSHAIKTRHRPRAKLMLIGHTHRAGVWMSEDYTLVNTGAFQPLARPLAIHLDERRAIVHQVRSRAGQFVLGKELHHIDLR